MKVPLLLALALGPALMLGASLSHGTGSRIVGGGSAVLGEYPYMVAVLFKNRTMCGGTILNENYILTAAHCIHNLELQYFEILSGSNLLSEATTVHVVTEALEHEEFIFQQNLPNDVGLMKVDPPFAFGEFVQPVTLIDQGLEIDDTTAFGFAVGWGMTFSGSSYPNELWKVELDVFSDAECIDAYMFGPTDRSICAGMSIGSSSQLGICGGDAGGPLIVDGIQVGIISWARVPCGEPGFPAVFAQVSYYTDWIKLHAGLTSK